MSIEHKGGKKLILKKDGDAWKLDGKAADAPFVKQYLKDLSDLTAVSFPEPNVQPKELDVPMLKVTLVIKEGDKESQKILSIGEKTQEMYAARIDGTSEPFYINEDGFHTVDISEEKLLPSQSSESTKAPKDKVE